MSTIKLNAGKSSGVSSPYKQAFNNFVNNPSVQSAETLSQVGKRYGVELGGITGNATTHAHNINPKSPKKATDVLKEIASRSIESGRVNNSNRQAKHLEFLKTKGQTQAENVSLRLSAQAAGIDKINKVRLSHTQNLADARYNNRENNANIKQGRLPVITAGNLARGALKSGDMKEFKRMDAHLSQIASDTKKQLAIETGKSSVNSSVVNMHKAVLSEITRQQNSISGVRSVYSASGNRRRKKRGGIFGMLGLDAALDADPVTMGLGLAVTAASSEFIGAKAYGALSGAEAPYRNARMGAFSEGVKNGTGGFYRGLYGHGIIAKNLTKYGLNQSDVLPTENAYGSALNGSAGQNRLMHLVGLARTTYGLGGMSGETYGKTLGLARQTGMIGGLQAGEGAHKYLEMFGKVTQKAVSKGVNSAEILHRLNSAVSMTLTPGVNGISRGEIGRIFRGDIAGGTASGKNGTLALSTLSGLMHGSSLEGRSSLQTEALVSYIDRYGPIKNRGDLKKALGPKLYNYVNFTKSGRRELGLTVKAYKDHQQMLGAQILGNATTGTILPYTAASYFTRKTMGVGMNSPIGAMGIAQTALGSNNAAALSETLGLAHHKLGVVATFGGKGNPLNSKATRLTMPEEMAQLRALGVSRLMAAGIAGNAQQESGFNAHAYNPNGGATGLFQWLGSRKAEFKKKMGVSLMHATAAQENYYAVWTLKHHYPKLYQQMKRAKTPQQEALLWAKFWERNVGNSDPQREQNAYIDYNTHLNAITGHYQNNGLGGAVATHALLTTKSSLVAKSAAVGSGVLAAHTLAKAATSGLVQDTAKAFGALNTGMGDAITGFKELATQVKSLTSTFKKLEKNLKSSGHTPLDKMWNNAVGIGADVLDPYSLL